MHLIRTVTGEWLVVETFTAVHDFMTLEAPYSLHINLKERQMIITPIVPFMSTDRMSLSKGQVWGIWPLTDESIIKMYQQAKSPIQIVEKNIITE